MENTDINSLLHDFEKKVSSRFDSRMRSDSMVLVPHCMLFMLSGIDFQNGRELLDRTIQSIVQNPSAALYVNLGNPSLDVSRQVQEVWNEARNSPAVNDLNMVYVFPVISAARTEGQELLFQDMRKVRKALRDNALTDIWLPFLIVERMAGKYGVFYQYAEAMKRFQQELTVASALKCCLMSTTNENGFSIPEESLLRTVALTAILHNNHDAVHITSTILNGDDLEQGRHFFTVKSASVFNPIRSVALLRTKFALFSLLESVDNPLEKIDYSFIRNALTEKRNRLPHSGDKITLFPFYGVIDGPEKELRLRRIQNFYYTSIIDFSEEELHGCCKSFLDLYLHYGSLSMLERSITDSTLYKALQSNLGMSSQEFDILDCPPPPFNRKEYSDIIRETEKSINSTNDTFLKKMMRFFRERTLPNIKAARMTLKRLEQAIEARQAELKYIELALPVNNTPSRPTFESVCTESFRDYFKESGDLLTDERVKIRKMLLTAMITGVLEPEQIMKTAFELVEDSLDTESAYMERVSQNCADPERVQAFENAINTWAIFPLRFRDSGRTSTPYVLGDPEHKLIRSMIENSSQIVTMKADRFDLVYVTDGFDISELPEWELLQTEGGIQA